MTFGTGYWRSIFGALFVAIAAIGDAASETPSGKPNRLLHEKSPYLRQHAYNPVDWFPWGDEALEKARRENKPIFLSIGYSTCHWCHVMEHESFSDPSVAAILNADYIAIKVDREERPDLDRVYMTFLQNMTGSGGWPLNVWLTPDLKPFFGGVYFPPEAKGGSPSFKTVLVQIAETWKSHRDETVAEANKLFTTLSADVRQSSAKNGFTSAKLRDHALADSRQNFDTAHGGFRGAPKFPLTPWIEFWLDVAATSPDAKSRDRAREMALKTLGEITRGGIYDHLGGGVHRYSTDALWRVPHFEKMLYDQAQLVNVLVSAAQMSADPALKSAAMETLDYVQRDLADPAGGFYSAEDADSAVMGGDAKIEGAFYVWTQAEIERLLGTEAGLFAYAFGVTPKGTADVSPKGANILYRAHSVEECAKKFKATADEVEQRLALSRAQLLAARERRPRPARDDKVVTAWNGLMISALARAGAAFNEPRYTTAAARAATFLQSRIYDESSGELARSFREDTRGARGFCEDYAFLISGLIDLYESTFEVRWLEWAAKLQEKQDQLFLDPAGGYFANATGDATVLLRLKPDSDDAEPSANSVSVRNLARLAALLHRDDWLERARGAAAAFAERVTRDPTLMPYLLVSADWMQGSPKQIVIHGKKDSADTLRLLAEVRRHFLARGVVILVDEESRPFFMPRLPVLADLPAGDPAAATAYVCENFACQLPTSDPGALAKQLAR